MRKMIKSGSPLEDSISFSRACRIGNITSVAGTAQTVIKPELSKIQKIEEKFRSMALNYGAIYISNEI